MDSIILMESEPVNLAENALNVETVEQNRNTCTDLNLGKKDTELNVETEKT